MQNEIFECKLEDSYWRHCLDTRRIEEERVERENEARNQRRRALEWRLIRGDNITEGDFPNYSPREYLEAMKEVERLKIESRYEIEKIECRLKTANCHCNGENAR